MVIGHEWYLAVKIELVGVDVLLQKHQVVGKEHEDAVLLLALLINNQDRGEK